jgi:hypothetical protein
LRGGVSQPLSFDGLFERRFDEGVSLDDGVGSQRLAASASMPLYDIVKFRNLI